MPWSVEALDRPETAAKKIADDFARLTLDPKEAVVKDAVADVVAKALSTALATQAMAVEVRASGSFINRTHSVTLNINTIYGFVED